jgi:hypothetical protein
MAKRKKISYDTNYRSVGKPLVNNLIEAEFIEYLDRPYETLEVYFKAKTFLHIDSDWKAKRTIKNLKQLIKYIKKNRENFTS